MVKMISSIVEYPNRVLKSGKTISTSAHAGKTSSFVYDSNDKLQMLRDKVVTRSKDGENTVITVTKKYFYNIKDSLIEKVTTTRVYDKLKNLVKETIEKVNY